MLFVGDLHIYVSDFSAALRFWAEGLGLEIAEREVTEHSAFARLNFPDGGSSIRLLGHAKPWSPDQPAPSSDHPGVRFDITTSDFDAVLVHLIEHGGRQVDEIESYNNLRIVTVADPDGTLFELLEIEDDEE